MSQTARLRQFLEENPDFKGTVRFSPAAAPRGQPFYNKDEVAAIPIMQVLQDFYGIAVTSKGGRQWCALRDENTASCCIYPNNTWCDFGAGNQGGDVIRLVQVMDGCKWKEALDRLGESYHISPENAAQSQQNGLADYEWRQLGIEPTMASQNLNIDIDRFGVRAALKYAEGHRMPVNDLREADPKTYYRMLRDRALIPLEADRDCYYSMLLNEYDLCKQIGGEAFAHENISAETEKMAEEITRQYALLRRAAPDKKALPVPSIHLSPHKDLEELLAGKIQFQEGPQRYYDMKNLARTRKESLFSVQVPSSVYLAAKHISSASLDQIPHAALRQNDMESLFVLRSDLIKIRRIFGEKALKIEQLSAPRQPQEAIKNPVRAAQFL